MLRSIRYTIQFFVLLISAFHCSAQVSDIEIVKGVADYRDFVLNRNEGSMDTLILQYGQLYTVDTEVYAEVRDLIEANINYVEEGIAIPKWITKRLVNTEQDSSRFDQNEFEDFLSRIYDHRDLMELIKEDILNVIPPFRISKTSTIFKELKFYQFDHGDVIADIGAGNGFLSFAIDHIVQEGEFYLSEIDTNMIRLIQLQKYHLSKSKEINHIHIINGFENDIRIPKKVDKIIFRNTLHHIENKKQIIERVKNYLKPNGELLVLEQDGTLTNKTLHNACFKANKIGEVKDLLVSSGFKIKREMKLSDIFYVMALERND